jgi:hypothetical protein
MQAVEYNESRMVDVGDGDEIDDGYAGDSDVAVGDSDDADGEETGRNEQDAFFNALPSDAALFSPGFTSQRLTRNRTASSKNSVKKSRAKALLVQLFSLLNIDSTEMGERFPPGGYSLSVLKYGCRRNFRRAQVNYIKLTSRIDRLFLPEKPGMCSSLFLRAQSLSDNLEYKQLTKLSENAIKLVLFGNPVVATVAQSLLASSHDRFCLKLKLNLAGEATAGEATPVRRSKLTMGRKKYTTSNKIFNVIVDGKDVPKTEYSYRVKAEGLKGVVNFLENALEPKPGVTRCLTIDSIFIPGLPVFSRGGTTILDLFEDYKKAAVQDKVGLAAFTDVAKALTRRDQIKTGLSTYLVKIRYSAKVCGEALKRLTVIESVKDLPGLEPGKFIKHDAEELRVELFDLMKYLSYEYSEEHLELSAADPAHCCTRGVNKDQECGHNHVGSECAKCSRIRSFFASNGRFQKVFDNIDSQIKNIQLNMVTKCEIDSMPRMRKVLEKDFTFYMAHRLRAKVQFAAIDKIKCTLAPGTVLLVIDHKQKVLPMRYREGMIEYFGKRGLSLLGGMLVRNVVNDDGVPGTVYEFYDCVVQNYSDQDNQQVMAVVEALIRAIKEKNPDVEDVIVQSDNASCLASHNKIPYIHFLNQELAAIGVRISKWINTEAQTGKGRLDTHFAYVNLHLTSYVENGNNVVVELDIYLGLCFKGGIMGTITILVDCGALSGVRTDNPTSKRRATVLENDKDFKGKTGVRATHEIRWLKGTETENAAAKPVEIRTLSDVTKPELITIRKLTNHPKKKLVVSIEMLHRSSKAPLFVPTDPELRRGRKRRRQPEVDINVEGQSAKLTKGTRLKEVLEESVGTSAATSSGESNHIATIPSSGLFKPGWACYPSKKDNAPPGLGVGTMELLHDLFVKDQQDAAKKLSGDQSHALVMDLVADRDWYERLIVTPLRCKAFFGLKPTDQKKTITKAKQAAAATVAEAATRATATAGARGDALLEAEVDDEIEALIIEGEKEVCELEEEGDECEEEESD